VEDHLGAAHVGPAGRYDRLRYEAEIRAFIVDAAGQQSRWDPRRIHDRENRIAPGFALIPRLFALPRLVDDYIALTAINSAVTLTYIEFMFDSVRVKAGITRITRLSAGGNEGGPLGGGALPVLPALGELLPGGLARGSVVAAGPWSLLCLALAAGASVAGAWCAVAGVPQLGVSAAAAVGLDPARMLLVADPGAAWPQVVASLLDGCELVLLRPPGQATAQVRRRLEAVLRRQGGVLVVAGDWDGAQARLLVTRQEWAGIEAGHGRLRARRVLVVADGRGAAARARSRWLWLPGPDGSVGPAGETVAEMRDTG
jgi:hypothetical protein